MWKPFTSSAKVRIVLQEAPEQGRASGSFLELESAEETGRCEFVAGMVGVQQN